MSDLVEKCERVLAAVTALLLFTLNDIRMFRTLPHTAEPETGHTQSIWLQLLGASGQVFATPVDVGIRWGLAALVIGLCIWALADSFRREPVTE